MLGSGTAEHEGLGSAGGVGLVPPGTPRMLADKRQEPEKGMGPLFFSFAFHKLVFFPVLCVTCMC